jgi:signal transduction histidine kinase/DNA-binding response OmpR family regulator
LGEQSGTPTSMPAAFPSCWKKQLLVTGLVVSCILACSFLVQNFLWKYAVREASRERMAALAQDAFLFNARLRARANDIFFLKRVAEQGIAQNPGAVLDSPNLRSAVTTMMLARSQYDQVRLLDLSGREIFRYNLKEGSSDLEEVPAPLLQDKSTRPYFAETMAAPENSVVYSPLDLNIEHNQIEKPYKPTIRVSGKIIGPDGKPRALLVLNYLGDQLFREVREQTNTDTRTLLLNSDGYWLSGPDPQEDFAFMFPEKKQASLKEQDPVLWKRFSRKSGWFDQGGDLYCFTNINPAAAVTDYPPLRLPITAGDRLKWTILKVTPNGVVWRQVNDIRRGIWLGCLGLIALLGPISWFGVSILHRRRIAQRQLKESQQQLLASLAHEQELTRRAQAAEKAKSEFLAVMSHEIRTPMNGVVGMTSILSDTDLSVTQRDCVTTIQTSGEALLNVINDILDFSKIDAGKMALEYRPFNLPKCIEDVVDLFVAEIRKKRLEAGYLIAPEVPTNVIGDSTRLRQILTNLIGNAVKFTAKGEIILNVNGEKEEDKGYRLTFSVTDTGIGIARDGMANLFQSFQQVDSSTTRRFGGTGLGLAISKRLAELMGGTMWVESEPNVGSTFFFTVLLKAAPVVETIRKESDPALLKSHPVLIVDDNATNRNILTSQLKTWGMDPTCAGSGAEALEKLREGHFEAVLVDLQMPEMDGLMLAREIRRTSQIPLILLSSMGDTQVGETGDLFNFQIQKPVKQSQLMSALQEITGIGLGAKQKTPTKRFDVSMAADHPLRVLVAEDNKVNQKVGLLMLAKLGYQADLAANGREALEAATKKPYDLILMDVQMPEMDGIEAARRIREQCGKECPFIAALTADALQGDRERLLALSFDEYLSKPLSAEALQNLLRSVPARPAATAS